MLFDKCVNNYLSYHKNVISFKCLPSQSLLSIIEDESIRLDIERGLIGGMCKPSAGINSLHVICLVDSLDRLWNVSTIIKKHVCFLLEKTQNFFFLQNRINESCTKIIIFFCKNQSVLNFANWYITISVAYMCTFGAWRHAY